MVSNPRIEELRRRVAADPASIAFAQLGEEYRRAGEVAQAIRVCRTGLMRHPDYLSARVTLGRALLDNNELDAARAEFEVVLRAAPENLAAIRGLAEIHQRKGDLEAALLQYRNALQLARDAADVQQTIADLEQKVAAERKGPPVAAIEAPKVAPGEPLVPTPAPVPAVEEQKIEIVETPRAGAVEQMMEPAAGTGSAPFSETTSMQLDGLERFLTAIRNRRARTGG